MSEQREPVLCYIEGQWAFFTTQDLAKQWGDDWNDAPYEHNAGRPYGPHEGEDFKIVQVAFETHLETPADRANSYSPYSVQTINAGAAAWLSTPEYYSSSHVAIPAGTPLSRFVELIRQAGGRVWLEAPPGSD